MKITIEITDISELINLRDWLNAMPENAILEFEDKPKFDLTQSIDVLEFSIMVGNCLRDKNIYTVGDLVKRSESELLETKNLGKKALREVIEVLSTVGLSLRATGTYKSVDNIKEQG